jgi:hypothetical protein
MLSCLATSHNQQFLFVLHLKKHLAVQQFNEDEEVKKSLHGCINGGGDFYNTGIQKLIPRLNICPDKNGDMFKNS